MGLQLSRGRFVEIHDSKRGVRWVRSVGKLNTKSQTPNTSETPKIQISSHVRPMKYRSFSQHAAALSLGAVLSWGLERWWRSLSAEALWRFVPWLLLACVA